MNKLGGNVSSDLVRLQADGLGITDAIYFERDASMLAQALLTRANNAGKVSDRQAFSCIRMAQQLYSQFHSPSSRLSVTLQSHRDKGEQISVVPRSGQRPDQRLLSTAVLAELRLTLLDKALEPLELAFAITPFRKSLLSISEPACSAALPQPGRQKNIIKPKDL